MSYKTIKLKKYGDIVNEYPAGGAILPGSQVTINADGEAIVNATAGGPAPGNFALEDELQGKTTRDAYEEGDVVFVWSVQPGEEVLALIDDQFDPDIGAILEPNAGGELRAQSAGVGMFQVIGEKIVDEDDNHRIPVRRL